MIADFKPEHAGTPDEELKAAELGAMEGAKAAIKQLRTRNFDTWYGKKILDERKPKLLTARQLYKEILTKRGPEIYGIRFRLTKYNRPIIKLLCYYFTNDTKFEFNGIHIVDGKTVPKPRLDEYGRQYSLNKNLFIVGPVGCGKTTMLEMFKKNQKQSFAIRSCLRISDDYQKNGIAAIEKYFSTIHAHDPFEYYGQTVIGVSFDDLGTEVPKSNFGNKANVMRDIFLARYELKLKAGMTHVTTNNYPAEVTKRYGLDEIDQSRLSSRFREMFNVIKYPHDAPDMRQ